MKKSISIIIAILSIILLVGCTNNNSNNNVANNQGGTQVNNNTNVNDAVNDNQKQEEELPTTKIEGEKTLETLTFSDIKIVEKDVNQNLLVATVTNNTAEDFSTRILDIELFDENNESIGIVGAILPDVPANGKATMEVPIAASVMNTSNIAIKNAGV